MIEYRAVAPVAAKGKRDPVPAWEAVQARTRLGVDVPHQPRTELVGRDRELGVLREALARVRAERSPQLVTLVGVPGIGKSRLVHELWQVAEADPDLVSWRQGRSLPYGEGVSFWALAEMVKAQAGILEDDSPDQAGAKLAAMTADVLGGVPEADWVARHLGALAGVGGDGTPAGGDRSEVFSAWRQFVEALAEARPLVLVFEDLHWADDGLLDFVDYLVDWAGGVPLLVVGTARPELLARRPGWAGGKPNALTLLLAPLSEEDTARLIGSLSGRPVLEARQQAMLLAQAGGNPLYAEQYVQMLAEQGDGQQPHLPDQSRASSRHGWTCWPRRTSGCCKTPRRSGRCSGRGRSPRSAAGQAVVSWKRICTGWSASSSSAASATRRWPAKPSTRLCTCCCAMWLMGRSRGRPGPAGMPPRPAGSSRWAERRITPRCSRTTI